MSQMGLMVMACGLGAFSVGMFHLTTHAFFKACLFLGAGAVLHALGGEEDMRRMGGLARRLPFTFGVFALMAEAGIRVHMGSRSYRPTISLPDVDSKLLKPQNIVEMLHVGSRDLGFAGADWVAELGVDIAPRLRTLKVAEPAKRAAGIKVADVAELVSRLRDEAKVI